MKFNKIGKSGHIFGGHVLGNYQADGASSVTISSRGYAPGTYMVLVETPDDGITTHNVSVVGS